MTNPQHSGGRSALRWTWIIAAAALLAAVAAGTYRAWVAESQPLAEARRAYASGNYELALRWANWMLRQSPLDKDGLRLQARSLVRLKQDARGLAVFQQIPDHEPEDDYLIGLASLRQGATGIGISLLQRSLERAPNAETRRALIVAHNQANQIEPAIAQAKELLKDPAERNVALAMLGELYFANDRPKESFEAFDELLQRNPEMKGVAFSLLHVQERQFESALKMGHHDTALKILDKMGNIESIPSTLLLRARVYHAMGKSEDAERDLRSVLRQQPTNVDAMQELASVLIELNRLADALPLLEKVVELRPEELAARQQLANVLRRLGRPKDAEVHQQVADDLRSRPPG